MKDKQDNYQPGDIDDTVVINVGGVRHEVLLTTLKSIPGTKLTDLNKLSSHYRKSKGEYFFDRHAGIFSSILNYYRTGELHMPQDVCGPVFSMELEFWELNELKIEECCWIRYNVDRETKKLMETLQKAEEESISLNRFVISDEEAWSTKSCCRVWHKIQSYMWSFLDNPHSSTGAKIHAIILFLLAMVSITIFCIETHPTFQVELTIDQYAHYYGVDTNDLHEDWYGDAQHNENSTGAPERRNGTKYGNNETKYAPHPTLSIIDQFLTAIFTVDIILRFTSCPRKLHFFRSFLNVVDLLSVIPFYIELVIEAVHIKESFEHNFLDGLFTLKVLRIFRIMRLLRHYKGQQVLFLTMKYSWKELVLMTVFLFISTIIFASLIYFTNKNEVFQSIPHSFWWAVVTMTTVGYGDMTPSTNAGYFVGALCALCGVLVVAFTVPTLVNNFLMFYSHVQYKRSGMKLKDIKVSRVLPTENLTNSLELTPKSTKSEKDNCEEV